MRLMTIGACLVSATLLTGCTASSFMTVNNERESVVEEARAANFTADMSISLGMTYNTGEIDGNYTDRDASISYSTHAELDNGKAYLRFEGSLMGFSINSDGYCTIKGNNATMYSRYGDTGNFYRYNLPLTETALNFLAKFRDFGDGLELPVNTDENTEIITVNCGVDGGKISDKLSGIQLPAYIGYDSRTGIPLSLDIELGEALPELQEAFIGDTYTTAQFDTFNLHVDYSNIGNTEVNIAADIINNSEETDLINWRAYGIDPNNVAEDSHINEYIGMLGLDKAGTWEWNKSFMFSGVDWEAWGIDPDNFYESSHLKDYAEILGVDKWLG